MNQHAINARAYGMAQGAMSELKAAIFLLLTEASEPGLRNVDIGRALGIYAGHEAHEGHIPRALLSIMESDGTVSQDSETKRWTIQSNI